MIAHQSLKSPVCPCVSITLPGAETVLASHWKVSDKATSLLMTEFMRRRREGESRVSAWRQAQLTPFALEEFFKSLLLVGFHPHRTGEMKVHSR
jgi:hypothetical protein